ncbi:MAG: DUF4974 domain-containing protein [Muribaculaceae bacterium]|nr:DUF4974 domain-containing protein [Muribaculaceae bacterium]
MDKYNLVLDIIEYPEKYSSEQLAEILSDPETEDIYNLLCNVASCVETVKEPDVEAEWKAFSENCSIRNRRKVLWLGSRAASIATFFFTSIVALAAGIAMIVAVIDHKQRPNIENGAVAPSRAIGSTNILTVPSDTIGKSLAPIIFENETLEVIMNTIADTYGIEVKFRNPETAELHLYYKLDRSLPLSELVDQLNAFEQINIKQNGSILTVE